MKHFATELCMVCAATAFASSRVEVSVLPSGEYADTDAGRTHSWTFARNGGEWQARRLSVWVK